MYPEFLTNLFEQGRARVGPVAPIDDEEIAAAARVLADYEAIDRRQAPGEAPAFVPQAAAWAGLQFYRACQLVVFRAHGEEDVRRELDRPYEGQRDAAEHYSVDLVFRYLPDLYRLASTGAEHDPLLEFLRGWARDWPLSSVGMAGVTALAAKETAGAEPQGESKPLRTRPPALDVSAVIEDPSLRILYVDRIVATADVSRLDDARVVEQVRAVLGVHPALAATIHPALRKRLALGEHLETGAV
jgi:hypothetical protein